MFLQTNFMHGVRDSGSRVWTGGAWVLGGADVGVEFAMRILRVRQDALEYWRPAKIGGQDGPPYPF